MKKEIKELEGKNYDLELENEVLKRDVPMQLQPIPEDEKLLQSMPTEYYHMDADNQRIGCLSRLSALFRRK
jgi:hypothetical protein